MAIFLNKISKTLTTGVVVIPLVSGFLLANCSMESGMQGLEAGKRSGGNHGPSGDGAPEVFDSAKECGVPQEKLDDPNAVLLDMTMTSFPIVVEGSQMGATFRVITQAKVHVTAKADETIQDIQVSVKDTAATGSGIVGAIAPMMVKSKAEAATKANSGAMITKGLPKKDWFKLINGSVPEFKNLLCAVSPVQTITLTKPAGSGTVTFSPFLIMSVSPFAPPERVKKELGSGFSYAVTASVANGAGDLKDTGTVQGRVTIKEVQPTFTYMEKTITANLAYEFTMDFPGGAYKLGIPHKQTIFIDTVNKKIKALIADMAKTDPETKKPLPVNYIVAD